MKSIITRLCTLCAFFVATVYLPIPKLLAAQPARIVGKVVQAEDGKSIEFAVISLEPSKIYTSTDVDGCYIIEGVAPGAYTLTASFFGMESVQAKVNVSQGKTVTINFELEQTSFRMEEVTVTATRGEAGKATSSMISRQAMDHLQASSLADVMSLMPGVAISNSTLEKVGSLSLRANQNGNASAANAMNSLGTAVIVDGAPISNNANLQVLSPAVTTGNLSLDNEASPISGVDVRSISTDNVESVEIIRGVASVQYGDMTSGAVIVKSKAGASPLVLRVRTNPNIYQASLGKGIQTQKAGSFNFSTDYAYNTTKLTAQYKYYQRLNGKVLWSKTFGALNTNTSAQFTYAKDTHDQNPDDLTLKIAEGASELSGRLSSNGHANFANAGLLKSIEYSLSGGYADKTSFREEQATNAMSLYTTSLGESVVSNLPGLEVYDKDGSKITSYAPGDENAVATVMPYSYFTHYDIFGRELNAYGKVVANFFGRFGGIDNAFLLGADFRIDGNLGRGIVFPDGMPPLRSLSNTDSGFRTRSYRDIPFIRQTGLFAEDSFQWQIGERKLSAVAGLRYDLVNGKSVLQPRINAAFDILPENLTFRAGWGISAKAPTAIYLYPQNAYFDAVLYNNMYSSLPKDDELVVASTKVFETANPDLQIATLSKTEFGLDINLGRIKAAFTAYHEQMDNGYSFSTSLATIHLVKMQGYELAEKVPGQRPSLKPSEPYNKFFKYARPDNRSSSRSSDLEFELDFGRVDAIRTSFYLNGAWTWSKSWGNGESYSARQNPLTPGVYHIGIYAPGTEKYCSEGLLSTFRAVHNIPELGFVVSLTAQVDWFDRWWSEYHNDDMFIAYISHSDGKRYDFDPAKRNDPEFAYMFPTLSEKRFIVERTQPYLLLNLNVSKEIGDTLTASFFVNNLLNNRPKYEYKSSPGTYTELGIPMFFGFEMKVTLK